MYLYAFNFIILLLRVEYEADQNNVHRKVILISFMLSVFGNGA
jgi:hypothetical protein